MYSKVQFGTFAREGKMPYYFDEDFEKLAQTIRIALGLDDQVRIDVIEFLRRLKHNGYIADYVRVPDTKMPHAEAEYNPDDRKIYLRESVYAGAAGWNDRARFTIIHEGAHALYDHQFRRKRSITGNPITELRVSSIRRDEVHANKLAASILAPYHCAEFSLRTTDRDLMARFGLSAAAAAKRYDEMAGIFRRSKNLPRKLPPGVIDFLAARRREGYAVTSIPPEDLVAVQVRQPIYTGDICPACGGCKMIRIGTHLKCESDDCGAITGED